ncbi:MAG: zinc ABC transporter substrate-binding protein, partial [Rhodospirillaceae bacterium]|nr:zinc ABC transporter substrate-binding protein [Rhodospirillaceae bacterium]
MADGRWRWARAARPVALALAAFVAATAVARAAEPLRVVATFSILADLVGRVGGEDVATRVLVPAGGDVHAYEAKPGDARALATADVVVLNGLGLEGWMTRLVEASGTRARIVVASAGVSGLAADADGGEGEGAAAPIDPHAWQDIANGQTYVRNIADGLAAADPSRAERYRHRAEAFLDELRDLDAWVRGEIARVPAEKRKIITSHDAFGYFGRAYGVTFRAPVGGGAGAPPPA